MTARPDDDDAEHRAAALVATARALELESLAGRLLPALDERGIRAILLKGPVIARWLYGDGEVRTYGDVDVLVEPRSLRLARRVVADVVDPGKVDLHETIEGIGVHPVRAFGVLHAGTVRERVGGHGDALTLGDPARALHLVLHAAWHGPAALKPVRDLEKGLELLPADLWIAAAVLAADLAAIPSFVTGLDLVESGRIVRRRLALPELETSRARLGFGAASAPAQRLADLDLAHGWRAKLRAVRRALVPPTAEVAARYPESGAGGLRLVRVHARRVLRRLAELPAALRLWRRAR